MDPNYLPPHLNEPAMEVVETNQAGPPVQRLEPTSALVTSHPSTNRVMTNGEVEILKVSGKSRPALVAGAIAGVVRQAGRVELQAIGAGATNQTVKAIAIARGYLITNGI